MLIRATCDGSDPTEPAGPPAAVPEGGGALLPEALEPRTNEGVSD